MSETGLQHLQAQIDSLMQHIGELQTQAALQRVESRLDIVAIQQEIMTNKIIDLGLRIGRLEVGRASPAMKAKINEADLCALRDRRTKAQQEREDLYVQQLIQAAQDSSSASPVLPGDQLNTLPLPDSVASPAASPAHLLEPVHDGSP